MDLICNGGGEHMAIVYGSQPCPLCASHAEIEALSKDAERWRHVRDCLAQAPLRAGGRPGGGYCA